LHPLGGRRKTYKTLTSYGNGSGERAARSRMEASKKMRGRFPDGRRLCRGEWGHVRLKRKSITAETPRSPSTAEPSPSAPLRVGTTNSERFSRRTLRLGGRLPYSARSI